MGRAMRFSGTATIVCAMLVLGQGAASAEPTSEARPSPSSPASARPASARPMTVQTPAAAQAADFDTGLSFDTTAAKVPPGSWVLLTPSYAVTGVPPAGADLGFSVTYPRGLAVEASNGQCTVSAATRTVHCTSPAEGARPQMRVTVDPTAAPGQVLALTATVDPVPGDSDPSDDVATATVTVVPLEAHVDVTAPATAREGQVFTVVVRLRNDGEVAVGDDFRGSVTMSDSGPGGGGELFRWVSLPQTCGTDPASYQCGAGGTVPPGGSTAYSFRLEALPGAAGKTFTMSARWAPTATTQVEDSVRVRILSSVVTRPGVVPPPVTRPGTPARPDTAEPSPDELAATGGQSAPLAALAIAMLVLGAAMLRLGRRTGR